MRIDATKINTHINNIDLFICSSGFESRSKSFALAIDSEKIKNAIIFHIDENYTLSYNNLIELKSRIKNLETVEHPKNNPIETYDIILRRLDDFYIQNQTKEKFEIIVDVTTFTREILLILFKALNHKCYLSKAQINLIYTPAESYPCEWLTKGVRYIRSIFGFSGMMLPSRKLMLVVLNGFENERTEEIIKSFEPNAILLGKPSYSESINRELCETGDSKFEEINQKHSSKIVEQFEFSCVEIEKTIFTIEELIKKYGDHYNIVLSPLNNKISTIAIAIVALNNENVQVCYASANQYNINEYSVPCNYFLFFGMNNFLKESN